MNDGHGAIQINDIDRKSHAQSMNAVAGNNPEASTITEVTRSESEQATQPRPVGVGDGQRCGEIGLASGVWLKGAVPARKNTAIKAERSPIMVQLFVLPTSARPRQGRAAGPVR